MKIQRIVPLFALLAFILALGGMFAAPAVADAAPASSGIITGIVQNGSHNNAPVPHQSVTLAVYVNHTTAQTVGTTTTNGSGVFTFNGLDTSSSNVYALSTTYQGGAYAGATISFGSDGAPQHTTLTVFDSTTSDATVSISALTVLVSAPNAHQGTIPVGEFITFKNTGPKAFVGNVAPANGLPMGLLRFALPAGATNLSMGAGFGQTQVFQVSSGFGATATVPPGTSQFAFAYDVPYTSSTYAFSLKAEYPTAKVTILLPANLSVSHGSLSRKPDVTVIGMKYHLYDADNVPVNAVTATTFTDLPLPGEAPDLSIPLLLVIVALLLVLLGVATWLYLTRGDLASILPDTKVGRGARAKTAPESPPAQDEATRKRLLSELLVLENRHARGSISGEEYERTRTRLRDELKAILRAEGEPRSASSALVAEPEEAVSTETTAMRQGEPLAGGHS